MTAVVIQNQPNISMLFDPKLLVILVFVVINFLIITKVKTRTSTIISLIISHLILVLFLSISISSYNSFKEIVLGLVAYSMVVLFLISTHSTIFVKSPKRTENQSLIEIFFGTISIAAIVLIVFVALFLVARNVAEIANLVDDQKVETQDILSENPMTSTNHPVHREIEKYYLGKKLEDQDVWLNKSQTFEVDEKKWTRLKDKLSDNFLLKRSSDVILIIVAVSTTLLLLSRKKPETN